MLCLQQKVFLACFYDAGSFCLSLSDDLAGRMVNRISLASVLMMRALAAPWCRSFLSAADVLLRLCQQALAATWSKLCQVMLMMLALAGPLVKSLSLLSCPCDVLDTCSRCCVCLESHPSDAAFRTCWLWRQWKLPLLLLQ